MKALVLVLFAFLGGAQEDADAGSPDVFARTPAELPRAEPERWQGFFDSEAGAAFRASLGAEQLARLDAAERAVREGDFPSALEQLYASLEASPDLPPALLVLGTAYFRLRRYGDSAVAYERFLAHAPGELWRTQALGHDYYSLGEYERARAHYERVLEKLPESVECLRGLALAHLHLGEPERALELLLRARALRPDHGEILTWTARVLADLDRLEEALELSERARELLPLDPRPWFVALEVLWALERDEEAARCERRWREVDRFAQAMRQVDALLRIRPRELSLHLRAVDLCRSMGEVSAVRERLGRLLWARPEGITEVELRILILDTLFDMGDVEGARRAAEALEGACGDEAATWQRLERYYALIGDRMGRVRAGERYLRMRTRPKANE